MSPDDAPPSPADRSRAGKAPDVRPAGASSASAGQAGADADTALVPPPSDPGHPFPRQGDLPQTLPSEAVGGIGAGPAESALAADAAPAPPEGGADPPARPDQSAAGLTTVAPLPPPLPG